MIIWRLTKPQTIPLAFNGLGAQKYGGRWNNQGTKVVYCASTTSLTVLENLVHFDSDIAPSLTLFSANLRDLKIENTDLSSILNDPSEMRAHGDEWVLQKRSVALIVPSVIVPNEMNILLNPDHGDFGLINLSEIGPFDIEKRLL